MNDIEGRVERVRDRIRAAAARAGRDPESVTLVAVSKTFPAPAVLAAVRAGVTDVGENRAQEMVDKARLLNDEVRWHFVGRLQTNKVRHVVGLASLIHSIDGIDLAEVVGRRAAGRGIEQDVLIEVNLSGESTKTGVVPEDAVDVARRVAAVEGLVVRGLMTIPSWPEDPEDSRAAYKTLAALSMEVQRDLPGAHHLSMGMTRDFDVAVEEGATIVRVGEAIFGSRARG